jgi:hypothetical protein
MTEVAQNQPVESTPQGSEEEQLELIADSVSGEEGTTDETLNEGDAPAEPEKPVTRRDKRISQLTFDKHEIERTKNAEIAALTQRLETQKQAAPAVQEGKPTRAQFDYDDDQYFEALVDWKADQKVNAYAATQATAAQATQNSQAVADWNQKSQGYASENPEYLDISAQRGAAVTSEAVAAFLTSSKIGPKMHHELLENFEDLQRIQALPDWQQGAELTKLETSLSKVKAKEKSKAPPPVTPVGSGKSASTSSTAGSMPTNW